MLIDQARIFVSGGKGGNGCQSLFKDIFHRRGIPDGGDGGDGGDIIIESNSNLHTLLDFKYQQHHKAGNGKHGGSNHKNGKRGDDFVLRVPVGTIVKDGEHNLVLKDFTVSGQRAVIATGGRGGKGNSKGREATQGEEGEHKTLFLELKLVADVGIIGFPNAGKSTLISRISKSQSKIAPYPFTTKSPKLGVVTAYNGETFVMADMPGLIEGAHQGRGLGDKFLRHIERTKILLHLIDLSDDIETSPVYRYQKLEKELKLYSEKVYNKMRIVVANKMDMPGAEENLKEFEKETNIKPIAISALSGKGLKDLTGIIYEKIKEEREILEEDNDQDWDESPY